MNTPLDGSILAYCIAGRAGGTIRGPTLQKVMTDYQKSSQANSRKALCHKGLREITANYNWKILALITRRSEVQVLPPQPTKPLISKEIGGFSSLFERKNFREKRGG